MKMRIIFVGLVMFMVAAMSAIADESDMESVNDPGLNSAAPARILHPSLLDRLNRGEETVDVIVLLKGYKEYVGKIKAYRPAEMKMYHSEIHGKQDRVLDRLDRPHFRLKHRFDNILGFAGTVSRHGLEALLGMPEVEVIEEDRKVEALTKEGIPLMNGLQARSSYDGAGVSIAIVDSGINYKHIKLGGTMPDGGSFPNAKVIGGYDFGDDDADPMDYTGHGTRVAGIAAGTRTTGGGEYIGGVAPNAKLYALKISKNSETGSEVSKVAAAWDWAITYKGKDPANPILIINTSYGFKKKLPDGTYELYTSVCDGDEPALAYFAQTAVNNGITLFAASGNDASTNAMRMPACLSNVISVGAVYDANIGSITVCSNYLKDTDACIGYCTDNPTAADKVACYSNSANFLDILAPGHNAYTTDIGNLLYYQYLGGTSAASPYAAGAAAILQSYAKATTGEFYSPAIIKAHLINNGKQITDAKNGITKPRVNIGNSLPSPDILWRHSGTGLNIIWYMNGATMVGYDWLNTVTDTNWKIVGVGNFNNDGNPDILWRHNSTGESIIWYMNGATMVGYDWLNTVTDTNWKIVGVRDFNSDGNPDILWRHNSTGENIIWYMNGAVMVGYDWLNTITDTNLKIVGVGDFNSDGKPDILWRHNSTGANIVWYMNGAVKTGSASLETLADTNWKIVGVGDFNTDGKPDILWRNDSTGLNIIWYMNGAVKTGSASLETLADTNWKIVGVRVFH